MTDSDRTTLMLAHGAFTDHDHPQAEGVSRITPDAVTRFAFDKHDGYRRIQLSNAVGPQGDGLLDLIDAIRLKGKRQVNVPGYKRAIILRIESTRGLDSFVAQKLGEAIEAYMAKYKAGQFATAAIGDLDVGKELHGKWNTLLMLRGEDGTWFVKNLRFTSITRSTDGDYAIQRGLRVGKIQPKELVATLLDDLDLQAALDSGYEIEEDGTYHLVRAPIDRGGAYAIVGGGTQVVYSDAFEVIASGKTDDTVMPAIDVDGTPTEMVTTVAGQGNDWTVRRGIPASAIQGPLARAYETPSA